MGEKLQKVLALAGIGSRREMERWIEQGRVSVDGRRASLGDRVEPHQIIRVDGRIIPRTPPERRVLAYHKPKGEVCTRSDPQGRPTVFDRLPRLRSARWVAVGRLDISTSGLLLLTTDGELANRLMHPSQEIEREYAVRVRWKVDDEVVRQLKRGVELEDGTARFNSIRDAGGEGGNHWYHVTLKEGRRREVRRLWQAVDVRVSRLIRIRYGPVVLPRGLRTGHWEELDRTAVDALLAAAAFKPDPDRGKSQIQPKAKPYRHRRAAKPNTGEGRAR